MKTFCFTVDDNIRFFKDLTFGEYHSIFEHPYLAVYKRLHEKFGLKVQLNLFYQTGDFNLSQMTEKYQDEWSKNSDWLKLSFHSKEENYRPYEFSSYEEVYADCKDVHQQIVRFATINALAKTTTVHYCRTTAQGLDALKDNGVMGLLGLYGDKDEPRTSYGIIEEHAEKIREGAIVEVNGTCHAGIDVVINEYSTEDVLQKLAGLTGRNHLNVMIHEQYFYPDYKAYQPDYEQKLCAVFDLLKNHDYKSKFLEELL